MPSFLLTAVPLYHPPFSQLPARQGCLSFPPAIFCICGKHTGWRCYFGQVPLVGCCTEGREMQRALGEQHLYSHSKLSPCMTCGFGGVNTMERDFQLAFSLRNAAKKLCCTTESLLWCLLQAGGQLAWVCWRSGKIPAGHLLGVLPARRLLQHHQPGCDSSPEAGEAAQAVSQLGPWRWLLGERRQPLWPRAIR